MRRIDKIIIHCSDSNLPNHDNIETIRQWHKGRGFSDVGYHFFIRSDGTIEKGRDLDIKGAHCQGKNNHSIGICLHGKYKEDFKGDQFISLTRLLKSLVTIFPNVTTHGHNEFSRKQCPVFDVTPYKKI